MVPTLPAQCTTCGAPLASGSDRCGRCGTLHGEHRKCPGCGAKAEVISKGGLLYVCAACGRPRVPMEQAGIKRSFREREALARSEAALSDSRLATVLAILAVVLATFVVLGFLLALVFDLGTLALLFGLVSAALGVASGFGFVRAKAAKKRAEASMHDAFGAVALDVLRQRGPTTSQGLAEILGVSESVADAALTKLPARDDVRVDTMIDDAAADGLVRYRIAEDATLPADHEALADPAAASFDARLKAAMQAKERS